MKRAIFAAVFFFAFEAVAGPFGLSKGMTLDEIKRQGPFVPGNVAGTYKSNSIANGHPDFESYMIVVSPRYGLCRIQATGKNVDSAASGTEMLARYADLTGALSQKYGAPSKAYDFLEVGSIWKDSQDWMMGLLKKERHLNAFWEKSQTNMLPDSLEIIGLYSYALSPSVGYFSLTYDFDNSDACLKAVKSKKNENL